VSGHRERQHQPVSPGESQRSFGGLIRRALSTRLTAGQPGETYLDTALASIGLAQEAWVGVKRAAAGSPSDAALRLLG
jgi:hypothetical protein